VDIILLIMPDMLRSRISESQSIFLLFNYQNNKLIGKLFRSQHQLFIVPLPLRVLPDTSALFSGFLQNYFIHPP